MLQVVLTSMHRYIPKIWIFQCDKASSFNELYSHPSTSFTFKETEFIAVTAYQVCGFPAIGKALCCKIYLYVIILYYENYESYRKWRILPSIFVMHVIKC